MFEEYKNKEVKVVINDGINKSTGADNIKSLRGIFLDEDEHFIKIKLFNGKQLAFNKEDVKKVRLDEESNQDKEGQENGEYQYQEPRD